ncbi:MAG: AtpZ/AtpI family protein [Myxococcales bacterium]|nr:AtpZ/AtpI family protein [Myxococcales bacterium]
MAGSEPSDGPGGRDDVASSYRKAQPYLDASWQLAGSVALGTLLGWWLDKKLGTNPWLLVVGALLGIGAGFYALFKAVIAMGKKK